MAFRMNCRVLRFRSPLIANITMERPPPFQGKCSHASPAGGCGALVGRQGGTKPGGMGSIGSVGKDKSGYFGASLLCRRSTPNWV
jgi:hypothetical protein